MNVKTFERLEFFDAARLDGSREHTQSRTSGWIRSNSLGSVVKQGEKSLKGDLKQAAVGKGIGPRRLQVTSSLFPTKGPSPGHWCGASWNKT